MENLYGRSVGPGIAWALSRVTGVLTFSVAEVLILGGGALVLFLTGRGIAETAHRQRRVGNLLMGGLLFSVGAAGLLVGLFYLLWGFQYSRPPVEERLAWPAGTGAPAEVLEDLAVQMIDATNSAYRALHGTDDLGEPTSLEDRGALEGALEEGWRRAAAAAGIRGGIAGRTYGPIKQPRFLSAALDWLGISGFYLPYTGEANVNRGIPAATYPHVAAHEKAHQRGFNPENEANFFGFLAAASAPDPIVRYAAYVFAQRQLLSALWAHDETRTRELLERRLPGVQRDIDDIRAYWGQFEGPVRDASRATNDAFLRTNRVDDGVLSYGRSVELMIAWARNQGGLLAPDGGA